MNNLLSSVLIKMIKKIILKNSIFMVIISIELLL